MPIPEYVCKECGGSGETIEYLNRPDTRGLCFECDFWMEKVQWRLENDSFAIVTDEFRHYHISPEDARGFRGFGGHKFVVYFNDGRKIVTTNLWSQGFVPEHFRDRLTPNAKLVE